MSGRSATAYASNSSSYLKMLGVFIASAALVLMIGSSAGLNDGSSLSGASHQPPATILSSEQIMHEVDRQVVEKVREMQGQAATGSKVYPPIARIPDSQKHRILVTGGAGFVGSHLVDRLMMQGHEVTVIDNFFTGRKANIQHWIGHPNFALVTHDVTQPFNLEVDRIYHLACPASPPHYQYNPVKTIKTSVLGTHNMLGLAKRVKARMLLTSTSEVYGDPLVHPQKETYWGNVNPIGPRACYDEGKRVAETMMFSYKQQDNVDIRVARIFNTFGPRMHPNDGRVVSNFIIQALQKKPLTVYGDGHNTRSFQFVSDLVSGLIRLMESDCSEPVNIGNPDETTIKDFAAKVRDIISPGTEIKYLPKTRDDPQKRKPDITRAKERLGWKPLVSVDAGLAATIKYFTEEVKRMNGEPSSVDSASFITNDPPQ